jgi:hypothetical protein
MDLFEEQIHEHAHQKYLIHTMDSRGQCLFTINEDKMNEYKKLQERCCDAALGVFQLVN